MTTRHWTVIDGKYVPMCAKHEAELEAWLSPSPETYRSMGGRGGMNIVQIGKPTVARIRAEQEAFVARANAALREQQEMIRRFCAQGAHCSSRLEDMWTGNGDGVRPVEDPADVETVAGP